MAQLEFHRGDLEREVQLISDIAKKFLTPESPSRLTQLKAQLAPLHASGGGRWAISEPIVSLATNNYAKGHGTKVWAEVSSTWELARKGGRKSNVLIVSGLASTRVSVVQSTNGDSERIALWRMEIGDDKSPGSYFHVHVQGADASLPFPSWLEVPRLPGHLCTPAVALEFVLGELFQDEWAQHVSQSLDPIQNWGALQKRRLEAYFNWQLATLADPDGLTVPWSALKRAQPTTTLIDGIRG